MVAKVAFEVVSEFIFEEAVALTATNKLTGAVENLSAKTDQAIFGVARLGKAYATQFLTGGAGFLGFLATAIKSSEKFKSTQIELANTMLANRFTVNGEVVKFNEALNISDGLLQGINKKASDFGISASALTEGTKTFANFLAPKGLAGDNLSNAVDLARVSVKGVPALGIDQNNATQQIASGIGGQLSKQTLFGTRLFAEAGDAISEVTNGVVKDIKTFNAAKPAVRVKALIAGLNKLAGTSDIVAARSELLSSRLNRLKETIFGISSILKPFGDALIKQIGPIIDIITDQINKKGPMMVAMATNLFKRLGETPEELFLNVKRFANLNQDIQSAGKALRFLSVSIIILGTAAQIGFIRSFTVSLIKMRGVVGGAALGFAKFSRFFQGLLGGGLLQRFALLIPTFGALIAIFQILSSAADKAKVQFYKLMDVFGGRFLKQTERLSTLMGLMIEPYNLVIDIFSDLLGKSFLLPLAFDVVLYLFQKMNDALQFFAIIIQSILIVIQAVGAGIGAILGTIYAGIQNPSLFLNGDFLKSIVTNPFEAAGNQVDTGVKSVVDRLLGGESKDKAVAKNIINADIKNTFNIKEKIEPDRIAFTITDHIKKLSENRRSASGRPLISAGG